MMQYIFSNAFIIKNIDLEGQFWGYASTYATDQALDKILPGAFKESLEAWQKNHQRFPFLHLEHHPKDIIGTCEQLYEDKLGLYVKGKLWMHLDKAKQIHEKLLSQNMGLSIGFYIQKSFQVKGVRHIEKLELQEISIVESPCNTEAMIHECKTLALEEEKCIKQIAQLSTLLRKKM